jgi:Putative Actinobacterial Holin-X, holin superfamily III
MEKESNSIESLLEKAGDYLETRVELMKLQAVDKITGTASSMASGVILIMIVGLMLFTLSIGIAVWLGDLLGEVYYGFFLVSGFYLLVAVILYLFRSKWLKKPLQDILVKKMIN